MIRPSPAWRDPDCFNYPRKQRHQDKIATPAPSEADSFSTLPTVSSLTWPELPWTLVKSENPQEEDYFIGYLQVCDTGKQSFAYRVGHPADLTSERSKASNTTNISSCLPTDGPSPLIRMVPGRIYKLVLMNFNSKSEPTNLHTHGLHVSGVGKVDDVTRNVEVGNCLVYEYRIPHISDVGTFWYHSHRHPLTANQVSQGSYGVLIVDETSEQLDTYPEHLKSFLTEKEVLFQYASILDKSVDPPIRTNIINGHINETIRLTWNINEWYYVRTSFVVVSDPINYLEFLPHDACEVRVVAYDGVYRSHIPHETASAKHMMTTSSRLDLAVQCQQPVSIYFHQGNLTDESKLIVIDLLDDDDQTEMFEETPE